jgi:CHAD domain-containing protein
MATKTEPNEPTNSNSHPAGEAELVHDARKAIKRMRALARLLREEIGEQEFQRVDSRLRESGRRLAASRDSEVRLATLTRLRTHHPKALALPGVERLQTQLQTDRAREGIARNGAVSQRRALEDVADMRSELSRWNLLDHDFDALAAGLERIYRQGRQRYTRAKRKRALPQDLHDWRKRVKALYYALDMLGGTKTKGTRRLTKRAQRLGDELGEEHDLFMLSAYIEAHPEALGEGDEAAKTLLKLIVRRRERLLERALADGARLYADSPADFTRRARHALSH